MLTTLTDLLWGPGTLTLLPGTGVYLTLRLRSAMVSAGVRPAQCPELRSASE